MKRHLIILLAVAACGAEHDIGIDAGVNLSPKTALLNTTFTAENIAANSLLSRGGQQVVATPACSNGQIPVYAGTVSGIQQWNCGNSSGTGTVTGVTATTGGGLVASGVAGITPSLGLLTSCGTGNVLAWNGSTWACSGAGAGTVTSVGATTNGGLVAAGTGTAPTIGLPLTGCTSGWVETWNGTSWGCAAAAAGGVSSVTATTNGGLVVGGTGSAPTVGMPLTGCTTGWVMTWNGTSWACAVASGGSANAVTNATAGTTGYVPLWNGAHTLTGTSDITDSVGSLLTLGDITDNLGTNVTISSVTLNAAGGLQSLVQNALGPIQGGVIRLSVSGALNNWTPTGLSGATTIFVNPTATTTLSGLTGGVDGRWINICNTNASNLLTIKNLSGLSTTANQFSLAAVGDWNLRPTATSGGPECAQFIYDGTSTTWRQQVTVDLPYLSVDTNAQIGAALLVTGVTTSAGDFKAQSHARVTGGAALTTGSLASCGTTPAVGSGSTDVAGTITNGTTNTGCTLTFATAYATNKPFCNCTSGTLATPVACTTTTTTIVETNASASGNIWTYQCWGP